MVIDFTKEELNNLIMCVHMQELLSRGSENYEQLKALHAKLKIFKED